MDTGPLRAAITGLIGLAVMEEEILLASAPYGEEGSPDRWAAVPLIAHNAEFRHQRPHPPPDGPVLRARRRPGWRK
jgi:hypothetical protein